MDNVRQLTRSNIASQLPLITTFSDHLAEAWNLLPLTEPLKKLSYLQSSADHQYQVYPERSVLGALALYHVVHLDLGIVTVYAHLLWTPQIHTLSGWRLTAALGKTSGPVFEEWCRVWAAML